MQVTDAWHDKVRPYYKKKPGGKYAKVLAKIEVGEWEHLAWKAVVHVSIIRDLSITDFYVCVWNDWLVCINVIRKF